MQTAKELKADIEIMERGIAAAQVKLAELEEKERTAKFEWDNSNAGFGKINMEVTTVKDGYGNLDIEVTNGNKTAKFTTEVAGMFKDSLDSWFAKHEVKG